jgi:hypothetical protein
MNWKLGPEHPLDESVPALIVDIDEVTNFCIMITKIAPQIV